MQYLSINILAFVGILFGYSCQENNPSIENEFAGTPVNIQIEDSTKVVKTEKEWRAQLTEEQYYVTREAGTERAFSGKYWDNKKEGVYNCIGCNLPLFSSDTKFKSGTGWPSFSQEIEKGATAINVDNKYGMTREEVVCARCDAHLGHVFNDGHEPTGLRYCMNSASLKFFAK